MYPRNLASWILTVMITGCMCSPVLASDFPTKPITLIVPWGAGGMTDLTARVLAESAKKHLGQPVIVENITGGGGAVAPGRLLDKKPDGYLLGIQGSCIQLAPYLSKLPYDSGRDFTQIIQVWGNPFGIFVRPNSPFKTLKDLIEYARANPGKLKHMSAGMGTGPHIIMTRFEDAAGVKFTHIPGKSDQEASTSLLGGHVDLIAGAMGSTTPLVQAGKLKLFATLGEERNKNFPEIPTLKEMGYNVVQISPMGVIGPKGMPRDLMKVLHNGFKKALEEPLFRSHCEKYGVSILYQNSEDFARSWGEACVEWGNFYNKFMKKE